MSRLQILPPPTIDFFFFFKGNLKESCVNNFDNLYAAANHDKMNAFLLLRMQKRRLVDVEILHYEE